MFGDRGGNLGRGNGSKGGNFLVLIEMDRVDMKHIFSTLPIYTKTCQRLSKLNYFNSNLMFVIKLI